MRFLRAFTAITCAAQAAALTINLGGEKLTVERDEGLQDVVSFDIIYTIRLRNGQIDVF